MSTDHEPNTERGSIENRGGFVSNMPGFLQIHKSNGIWTFLYVACILCMNKLFGFKIFLVYAFVQVSIKSTCRIKLTKLAYLVALGFRLRVDLILLTLLGLIE